MHSPRRTVAVIGSGVSGLTAAWILRSSADVVLFEAAPRLGGHAHTHDVVTPSGEQLAVDSGFIVHNRRTYPNLIKLFDQLGVSTQASEMSMSVRCEGCGLEYAGGRGARGIFARPRSALAPRFLGLLRDITRFHRSARAELARGGGPERSVGDFLDLHGFSDYFRSHYLTPLVSAVWSCDGSTAEQYPARYLFTFMDNHGMLSVTGSPQWRTVSGGSRSYVDLIGKQLPAVHTGTPVRTVLRGHDGVRIRTADDREYDADAVVIATHPDQALAMLADPSGVESSVLGSFRYSRNPTLLHTDSSLLPRRSGARASWNYLMSSCRVSAESVQVSYHMNRLQRLPGDVDYVVSLNAAQRVRPDTVIEQMDYEHPVYTTESVAAQARLPELASTRTAFAGAYHGWGFHEDGARSGVAAAQALGGSW